MTNIILVVALTLFGEASGESLIGKTAVASVIWNRAQNKGIPLRDVCMSPKQFSCWNGGKIPTHPKDPASEAAWNDCVRLATQMAEGEFVPTVKATHYYSGMTVPYWATKMRQVAVIGRHKFFVEK